MKTITLSLLSLAFLIPAAMQAAAPQSASESIGGPRFEQWRGVEPGTDGFTMAIPCEARWRHVDGPKGSYKHGFRVLNDSASDWHPYWGLSFDVRLEKGRALDLAVSVLSSEESGKEISAKTRMEGEGWRTVTLPWSAFDCETARSSWLFAVQELRIKSQYADSHPGRAGIRNVRVVRGVSVSLSSDVRGKSSKSGGAAEYVVAVGNCSAEPQEVTLSFVRYGWETMAAEVSPATLRLAPGETGNCTVRVQVPERVPSGGHEKQTLQAVANGDFAKAARIEFITASALPHPYLLHTPERWAEVRQKVKDLPWAKEQEEDFVRKAEAWVVPEIAKPPKNDPDDTMGPFLFATPNEHGLMACGVSWQLTGNKAHAGKVAEFLRRLSDPVEGYGRTFRGCNQGLVQEGHFFQHIAMAYDMIQDAGVLTEADRAQIEQTFRQLMETMDRANSRGAINNWNLSEMCGALYCALALQDLAAADRFFSGPGGVLEQLAKGTMDDGWWNECSISYNVWCASEFTQAALAMEPWGISSRHLRVPASYSPYVALRTELNGGGPAPSGDYARPRPFGMTDEIWGPMKRPFRQITDLWNGLLPFLDYRGVMIGVNDSTENKVGGPRLEVGGAPFELAYYAYRDPAYAGIIKRGGDGKRDLLYGVPDLPEVSPEPFRQSAAADNVGLAMLRSQSAERPIREQIQAALHYGTHGWAHGHYDRTNLISLMRYGRSFYNPESIWYGYEPFMYKFYVQTSLAHNMVVVDEKMQEAMPGRRLLFHSGKMMQAAAVETTARWSNPPYGGMVYDYVPVKTFQEKCWREGRFVPVPKTLPAYGALTGFTEPVLQRRLMLVLDDYVVVADYVKGEQAHTFESLFQMKGFQGIEAVRKKLLRHEAQWNPDPLGSAQFVTDCNWYAIEAPARSRFEMRFGPGADNSGTRALYSEDGALKLDVYSLWPKSQEVMIGAAPEDHAVEKRLFYTVRGDGNILAEGKFGAWILGQETIDAPLNGIKELELETRTELAKKPTLFWANAVVVGRDGKEIPVSQLPMRTENVTPAPKAGSDYFGGPVKIVGQTYDQVIAAEPKDASNPGLIHVDLRGLDAVRFKAIIGGDYPLGNEEQRRKTMALRAERGAAARFVSVIEPYENAPMVKSAEASDADHLRIELADGRVQEIELRGVESGGDLIQATVKERRAGVLLREEATRSGT